MAAGDYTVYDNAQSNYSGNMVVTGQSAATAADLQHYLGFTPSRVTFYALDDDGDAVVEYYQYIRGLDDAGSLKMDIDGGTGDEFSMETSNPITVEQVTATTIADETTGHDEDHKGQWLLTIPAELQTNSYFYSIVIER